MKRLLLYSFVFLFTASSFAQIGKGDITIAPQVGLNLSNYYNILQPLSNRARISFNAGAALDYHFADDWSFKTGLIYDSKGTRIPDTDFGDITERLTYLAVPVHVTFNWHIDQGNTLSIDFGPTLNFLIDENFEADDPSFQSPDGRVRSLDYGLGFGIGYSFEIADNLRFLIQTQTYYGLRSLTNEKLNDGFDEFNIFNLTYSLNAGLLFQL